jgi:hypothetical protein
MKFLEHKKLVFLIFIFINIILIIAYIALNNYYTNKKEIKLVSKEVSKENLLPESIVDFIDDPTYYSQLLKYIKNWNKSMDEGNTPLVTHFNNLNDAHELIVKEQQIASFNVTKRPKELNLTLNCSNQIYQSFLNTSIREKPARIIDLILISNELLVAEMRLFELYDIVDEIIIFETNITFKQVRKPYFFLSNLKRYRRFLDKIVLITPFNITCFNSKD